MFDDEQLQSLTEEERRDLAHRLSVLEGAPIERTERIRRERRLFMTLIFGSALFLIPWTIFLAVSLPKRFLTGHWDAAWVGFDIVLTASLALTAWAAWRRRHLLIFAALVTATLLIVDAWFDILTASPRNDLLVSLATGLLGNLPLATLLVIVSYRLVKVSAHTARRLAGDQEIDLPLRKLPLYGVDEVAGAGPG